jgi:hypothetical protein
MATERPQGTFDEGLPNWQHPAALVNRLYSQRWPSVQLKRCSGRLVQVEEAFYAGLNVPADHRHSLIRIPAVATDSP